MYNAPPWRALWELAAGGALQGIFGPALLAAPLGFAALRWKFGRLCWAAAALLALPWFFNSGARFLLPALPFVWLAFAMAAPRRTLWAAAAFQAVLCWPAMIDLYGGPHSWRLRGFPLRAAAGLEEEAAFLRRQVYEYPVARLIEEAVPPGARVFSLTPVAKAYTTRDVLVYWHSSRGERLADALRVAGLWSRDPLFELRGEWPARPLRGLRFRLGGKHTAEWDIREVRLFSRQDRVLASPQWTLSASSNPWDLPWAFDDNFATRWRSRDPMRPGMFVEVLFDRAQVLTAAVLVSQAPHAQGIPMEFEGLTPGGWRPLPARVAAQPHPEMFLRREATWTMRKAGFEYLLAPADESGNGALGKSLSAEPVEWGLEPAGQVGPYCLFRIR